MVQLTSEEKKDAVLDFCTREGSAADIAKKFDVSRGTLYKWKKQLLGEKESQNMKKSRKQTLSDDRDALLTEVESLKKQIYRQQMELDILNETAEIIKKDPGINPKNWRTGKKPD
jgi:transposase-like protein